MNAHAGYQGVGWSERASQPANLARQKRLDSVGFSAVNGGQFWRCIIRTLKCTACKVAGSVLARCLKPLLKIQAFALETSYCVGLNAGRPSTSLRHKKTANLSALPSRGVGPQLMRSWETVFPDHSP